jgi:adenine-specific DNA-methyltransferase
LTSSKKTDKSDKINDSMFKSENVGKSKPRKKQTKKKQTEVSTEESPVGQYVHPNEKRKNNPPVGMVDTNNDPDQPSNRYSYDPRLDPQLQWSGKTEHSEFDVDTVSLHVHERIDPLTIVEKTMNEQKQVQQSLFHYFELPENNPPLRDAIEFYKHEQNWSNRLIAGDSLLVMNSLLEKEGMEGHVQMIYVDPPYGIKYGSNFQPFVSQQNVDDRKDDDLTQEPETIKAFRDTWNLKIHSYLTFLRDRLLVARKLLKETGCCFVQINDENVHLVRILMDEIFGTRNFIALIPFRKKLMPLGSKTLESMGDYLVLYAKNTDEFKYHQLYVKSKPLASSRWTGLELKDGTRRMLTREERIDLLKIPPGSRVFRTVSQLAPSFSKNSVFPFEFEGITYNPPPGKCWLTSLEKMKKMVDAKRILVESSSPRYILYHDDFPYAKVTSPWYDTAPAQGKIFVVQTNEKVLERCIQMTTDPGDIILDPTCGSGTTAVVSEKLGRRWITCDSSRISITLAKKRLMTSIFDYYALAYPDEGLSSGFIYHTQLHTTLSTIVNNAKPNQTILYDQPKIDKNKKRISGPFTIEAVPSPTVKSIDELYKPNQSNTKISTQQEWRDELLRTGIRGKGSQRIKFSRIETHPASKWIHAIAETKEEKPKHVVIAFGPEHAPLEQRQVERVFEESQLLIPKPKIIIFAAMQFDPEAAKDIDKANYPGVVLLKAEMNKDLQTKDLKKKQSSNESFWLMGSPDVDYKKQKDGKYVVTVNGFDYYDTQTDEIKSGNASKIAMWEMDTDYDGRSLYPQQVFFPMDDKSGGWNKLAKTLRGNIDEDLITKYQGIESIPFDVGVNKRIAVKIIDDRGIESLKIIDLE